MAGLGTYLYINSQKMASSCSEYDAVCFAAAEAKEQSAKYVFVGAAFSLIVLPALFCIVRSANRPAASEESIGLVNERPSSSLSGVINFVTCGYAAQDRASSL